MSFLLWQKIYNFARLIFSLGEDLRQNRANNERLENEVRELNIVVQRLAFELPAGEGDNEK